MRRHCQAASFPVHQRGRRIEEVKQEGMKGFGEGTQRQATKAPGNQEGLWKAGYFMGRWDMWVKA